MRNLVGAQAMGGFLVLKWSVRFFYQTDQQQHGQE